MASDLKSLLISALNQGLPGESAHLPMAPLNRKISSLAIQDADNYKVSAVAVIISEQNNQHQVILIERPTYDGAHSGQIAFPGGKMEPTDANHEFTARRECFEEIGLALQDEHYIGQLTDVFIPVSSFLMHPHLYYVSEELSFTPDIREVASILSVTLETFNKEEVRITKDLPMQKEYILKNVPGFHIQNKFIWGATALVLNELNELLKRTKIAL
ncbi:MAG: CoA pyrophosphatase [Bacteroidota bacterium]